MALVPGLVTERERERIYLCSAAVYQSASLAVYRSAQPRPESAQCWTWSAGTANITLDHPLTFTERLEVVVVVVLVLVEFSTR